VVLLSAIALGRLLLGLGLILVFSLGLATVLSLLGVLVVRGAQFLERAPLFARLGRFVPVASAVLVTVLGVIFTLRAAWTLFD